MSGSKTRLGFFGGDEPPPSDPEGVSSQHAARTVIGHDIHLRPPPARPPLSGTPPTSREEPLPAVPETVTDETTEELPPRPSHTGKTKFPAFARLFGRWTTGGGFLERSRTSGDNADLPHVPREAWVSRLAIFVVAGFASFLLALAVLKLHQCSTSSSRPAAVGQASVPSTPSAPPAASAVPAVLPAPSAPPAPLAAASQPPAAATAPIAQHLVVRPNARHGEKAASGSSARAAPGATGKPRAQPLRPAHLTPTPGAAGKDVLLPLGI